MRQTLWRSAAAALLAVLLLPWAGTPAHASHAAGEGPIHLDPPVPTIAKEGEVELVEFFNFSCPACFRFQAPFNEWKRRMKPENVLLVRKPVVFERAGGLYARLYFSLEAVGKEEELFQAVFQAIHKKRRLLNSEGRILDWFEEQGLDRDQMEGVFNSFGVKSKVRRAQREADSYGADSTPQMVVAGKHRLTPTNYGDYLQLIRDMEDLLVAEGAVFPSRQEEEGQGEEAAGAEGDSAEGAAVN